MNVTKPLKLFDETQKLACQIHVMFTCDLTPSKCGIDYTQNDYRIAEFIENKIKMKEKENGASI